MCLIRRVNFRILLVHQNLYLVNSCYILQKIVWTTKYLNFLHCSRSQNLHSIIRVRNSNSFIYLYVLRNSIFYLHIRNWINAFFFCLFQFVIKFKYQVLSFFSYIFNDFIATKPLEYQVYKKFKPTYPPLHYLLDITSRIWNALNNQDLCLKIY